MWSKNREEYGVRLDNVEQDYWRYEYRYVSITTGYMKYCILRCSWIVKNRVQSSTKIYTMGTVYYKVVLQAVDKKWHLVKC